MTKAELLSLARSRLYDTATPYLWADAELTDYLEEAEAEAALRANLLEITGISTYCNITLADETSTYVLNSLVYDVITARVTGQSYFLKRTSREVLDRDRPAWGDETGTPTEYFITDTNITFYPQPTGAGTVTMTVLRLPIATMGTSPEINAKHHPRLIDWVMFRALSKRNSDSQSEQKARMYERAFEESFGPRFDAKQQTRQLKRTPTTMRDDSYFGEM
jgi:hypothetical protein